MNSRQRFLLTPDPLPITKPFKDGDLLGWAFAYEQATKYRKPPVLKDRPQAN